MTAPQPSPLVEKVADAIRKTMFFEHGQSKLQPETAAQAALAACEFDALLSALRAFADCSLRWTGKERFDPAATYLWSPNNGEGAISVQHILDARVLLARLEGKAV